MFTFSSFLGVELQPGNAPPISSTSSPVPMPWRVTLVDADGKTSKQMYSAPRPLRVDEIPEIIDYFRVGAKNALEAGGHFLPFPEL